jgi:hypothetical protein
VALALKIQVSFCANLWQMGMPVKLTTKSVVCVIVNGKNDNKTE